MTHTSLNIAGKIDPGTISVLAAVSRATGELGIPYVVVGAMARDLVLHHGHGFVIRRATRDIDLGIEVPGWDAPDGYRPACPVSAAASGWFSSLAATS